MYQQKTKKVFNQAVKYEAFDHFYHLEMCFPHIFNYLSQDQDQQMEDDYMKLFSETSYFSDLHGFESPY